MPLRRLYGEDLKKVGDPVGKELTKIDFSLIKEKVGVLQARFIRSFGDFELPMGVDIMEDEVVVCNMNGGTVEFYTFEGEMALKLPNDAQGGPKKYDQPAIATVLIDTRILVADKRGLHEYTASGTFVKSVRVKGTIYGVYPLRSPQGEIAILVESNQGRNNQYHLVVYDTGLENKIRQEKVKFEGEGKKTIRFSTSFGTRILLSDMHTKNQGIWMLDTKGNILFNNTRDDFDEIRMGENDEGKFIQAAGACFDARGNYMAICSMTSRIMAFRHDGSHICDVQFPEGVIKRPSDISINDDGKMAIVSISTGSCFMFDLLQSPDECSPDMECATRGPTPARGFRHPGRGRGQGRGHGRRGRGGVNVIPRVGTRGMRTRSRGQTHFRSMVPSRRGQRSIITHMPNRIKYSNF